MVNKGWSRPFDDPITTDDGFEIVTLRDAGSFILTLPPAEADRDHWQLAMKCIMDAAERGGILMLAQIAMQRALSHGKPAPPTEPRRKAAKKFRVIR
jgi:hypothetical protein